MEQEQLIRYMAERLFKNNRRQGKKDGREYIFHCPSPKAYPFQWFWDSCFHAMALVRLGEIELAKRELEGLFAWQRPSGFIPHVIFWDQSKVSGKLWHWHSLESKPLFKKPKTTEMIQPPVLAQAMEKIWQADQDHSFLEQYLPKALRYYQWLFEHRDPDGDNLISIIAPFESGLDWSPQFDQAFGLQNPSPLQLQFRARGAEALNKYFLRYSTKLIFRFGVFSVEEVLVNSILAQGLKSLSGLLGEIGAQQESQWALQKSFVVTLSLVGKCYDESKAAFFSLSGRKEKQLRVLTCASLMPLILEDIPSKIANRLVLRHLANPEEFWLPYPVPSVAANEKTFSPDGLLGGRPYLWRGPTWLNINRFLFHGLRQWKYQEIAKALVQRSRQFVLQSGFREYFNPFTGKGLGAQNFGWSTLIVDMV